MDNSKRSRYNGPGGSNDGRVVQLGSHQDPPADVYPFAIPVTGPEAQQVRAAVIAMIPGSTESMLKSPLPATLARRDIPNFQTVKNDYYICEKSDGERTVIYVSDHGCYLINRKLAVQKVIDDEFGLYSLLVEPGQAMLLDGEIITNYYDPAVDGNKDPETDVRAMVRKYDDADSYIAGTNSPRHYVYCMFDVAYFDQTSYINIDPYEVAGKNKDTNHRLSLTGQVKRRVQSILAPKLAEKFDADENLKDTLTDDAARYQYYLWNIAPLRFETKDFQRAKHMSNVLVNILRFKDETSFIYFNPAKQLKSKNDGFIFTPIANNYLMNEHENKILKYKWPSLNTVDFLIESPFFDAQGQLIVYSHTSDKSTGRKVDFEFNQIPLSAETREKVTAQIGNARVAVVECNYDKKDGKWVIKHVRTDKDRGNWWTTVLSCLNAMVDNLQPEELRDLLK